MRSGVYEKKSVNLRLCIGFELNLSLAKIAWLNYT